LSKNNSSYLVHLKAIDSNIGNLRPMRLSKILMKDFPAIVNIKRLGINSIVINFKFSFDANKFIEKSLLPENWLSYIPDYKLYRSGVVREVDVIIGRQ